MNELIVGERRQGKSTLALGEAARLSKTIVIWDPNRNYRHPAFISVHSPKQMEEALDAADPDVYTIIRVGPFRITELWEQFDAYAEAIWPFDEIALIVDEAHMLQSPQKINESLDRFLRQSPATTAIIQTTHRLYELNVLSRYLVDDVMIFRTMVPNELKLLRDQFQVDPETMKDLGDREYVRIQKRPNGPFHWRQPDSASWYVDLRNPNKRIAQSGNRG